MARAKKSITLCNNTEEAVKCAEAQGFKVKGGGNHLKIEPKEKGYPNVALGHNNGDWGKGLKHAIVKACLAIGMTVFVIGVVSLMN